MFPYYKLGFCTAKKNCVLYKYWGFISIYLRQSSRIVIKHVITVKDGAQSNPVVDVAHEAPTIFCGTNSLAGGAGKPQPSSTTWHEEEPTSTSYHPNKALGLPSPHVHWQI